jgi:uncharacterized protein (DUF1778 family)
MTDKQQIAAYVSDEQYRSVKAAADANDQSVSRWLIDAAQMRLDQEGVRSAAQQYRVEEHLLELVDEAADRAADRIVEQIDDGPDPDENVSWGDD